MARTIISKQQDHWLSSLLQDPEAEKWPPAFLSFTMNTSAVSRQDMPNLKLSQSGISAEASGKSGIMKQLLLT